MTPGLPTIHREATREWAQLRVAQFATEALQRPAGCAQVIKQRPPRNNETKANL